MLNLKKESAGYDYWIHGLYPHLHTFKPCFSEYWNQSLMENG
jgi:hypothetical protein